MFELHVKPCHREHAEAISEHLEANGALSVALVDQEDDPILEPGPGETPLWRYSIAEALYANAIDAEAAWQALLQDYPKLSHTLKAIPEQDWVRVCLDNMKPLLFGKNLWICPSSHTPPEPDAVNIMLDPGLAFGTGTHPTTSLCLTWLDSADIQDKKIIDYGCGSGILALAALKLNASLAYAVDLDDQALIATQNNAEKNNISNNKLICSKPEVLLTPVDILLANILLTPLLALESRFEALLKPSGTLVLSGVLATQVEQLLAAYAAPNWTHQETQYEDEWALVVFKKN
ncbi:MAG: 50S ribosomal protein L11 methyltransferase [Legionella sp.]|nr:50S ribosomal protein L11 methyltransferase [Legionella sp.]